MGTTDKPTSAGANSPSQSGQSQTKPQSPGQQKPRDNNPSGARSAQSGAERMGSVGQGEDAMDDDESDVETNKSPGAADRNRSDRDRTQVR